MKVEVTFDLEDGKDTLDYETFQKMHGLRKAYTSALEYSKVLENRGFEGEAQDLRNCLLKSVAEFDNQD